MTRKTLSLPADLVDRIASEASAADRSFNYMAVQKLRDAFLRPQTVRQLRRRSAKK